MNNHLLRELLDVNEAFERAFPNPAQHTLPNFLTYAHSAVTPEMISLQPAIRSYDGANVPSLQTNLAESLTKAYRHFRGYVKKALDTTPLLTFDDFISLVYLAERGSMTKTDLVEATVNEKPSGMLVIKRLVDQGFVSQSDDEEDKRSRRLTITAQGLALLHAVQLAMNQATGLLRSDLSPSEQQQLSYLLKRLDDFHTPLYLTHKDAQLTELLSFLPVHETAVGQLDH